MQTLPTILESNSIRVSVYPSPFSGECEEVTVPAGQSIIEIIGLDNPLENHELVVTHEGKLIPSLSWAEYIPEDGTRLAIGVLPKDRDFLAFVATISLAVFAGPAAAAINTSLLSGALGTTGLLLLEAGIIIGGTLLINRLFPISEALGTAQSPEVFGISGARNSLPGRTQPILSLYGEHRVYPFYAAQPYTEITGDDTQFINLLFDLGYGPIEIVNNDLLKIGDQPFSAFTGVTWTFFEGTPGQPSRVSSIYTQQHFTSPLSITLSRESEDTEASWQELSTPADITEVVINLSFAGLFSLDDDGDRQNREVEFEYQSRTLSMGDWSSTQTHTVSSNRTSTVFSSITISFGSNRGQHQVRIRRKTVDAEDTRTRDEATLYSLIGSNEDPPVNTNGRALFALRIKATEQLNRVVDSFNGIFRKKLQTYNTITKTWNPTYVGTSSVAWVFADILRGQGIFSPVADADIDGPALAAWDQYCTSQGYRFDGVIDGRRGVWDVLQLVGECGRGSPTIRNGHMYSVIIDQVKTVPVDLISPRDDLEFQGLKTFVDPPHGLTATFRDRSDNLYIEKEITVYDEGYTAMNAVDVRRVTVFGTTEVAQVHRRVRYSLAQARLRPEEFEITMDVKQIAITRGDYVDLIHDVPLVGLGQGRITDVTTSGNQWTGFSVDEDIPNPSDLTARLNARIQTFDGTHILEEVRRGAASRPRRTTPLTPLTEV